MEAKREENDFTEIIVQGLRAEMTNIGLPENNILGLLIRFKQELKEAGKDEMQKCVLKYKKEALSIINSLPPLESLKDEKTSELLSTSRTQVDSSNNNSTKFSTPSKGTSSSFMSFENQKMVLFHDKKSVLDEMLKKLPSSLISPSINDSSRHVRTLFMAFNTMIKLLKDYQDLNLDRELCLNWLKDKYTPYHAFVNNKPDLKTLEDIRDALVREFRLEAANDYELLNSFNHGDRHSDVQWAAYYYECAISLGFHGSNTEKSVVMPLINKLKNDKCRDLLRNLDDDKEMSLKEVTTWINQRQELVDNPKEIKKKHDSNKQNFRKENDSKRSESKSSNTSGNQVQSKSKKEEKNWSRKDSHFVLCFILIGF